MLILRERLHATLMDVNASTPIEDQALEPGDRLRLLRHVGGYWTFQVSDGVDKWFNYRSSDKPVTKSV